MTNNDNDNFSREDDIHSPSTTTRKLTQDELSQLRSSLSNEFIPLNKVDESMQQENVEGEKANYENISDLLDFVLAMVGNGKTAQYIEQELISMEMEECDTEKAKNVGIIISDFINLLEGPLKKLQEPEATFTKDEVSQQKIEEQEGAEENMGADDAANNLNETKQSTSKMKSLLVGVKYLLISFF